MRNHGFVCLPVIHGSNSMEATASPTLNKVDEAVAKNTTDNDTNSNSGELEEDKVLVELQATNMQIGVEEQLEQEEAFLEEIEDAKNKEMEEAEQEEAELEANGGEVEEDDNENDLPRSYFCKTKPAQLYAKLTGVIEKHVKEKYLSILQHPYLSQKNQAMNG